MRKFLPVVFCGIAAISYSQLTLAGDDAYKSKDNSAAGATDNPNVSRDAQGREHMNQGKHTGQYKNKKDKDDSYSSGSGSTSERKKDDSYGASSSGNGSMSSDPATKSDSTAGARSSDSSLPSVTGSASGSARTDVNK